MPAVRSANTATAELLVWMTPGHSLYTILSKIHLPFQAQSAGDLLMTRHTLKSQNAERTPVRRINVYLQYVSAASMNLQAPCGVSVHVITGRRAGHSQSREACVTNDQSVRRRFHPSHAACYSEEACLCSRSRICFVADCGLSEKSNFNK